MNTIQRITLIALIALASPTAIYSQAPGSNAQNVRLTAPIPATVNQVTAQTVGTQGSRQFYYWVVAKYPIGNAYPFGPAQVFKVADTLTGGNYVRISWQGLQNATSYDVLRTTTPSLPQGTASILIANVVAPTTSYNNTAETITSYTVASAGAANADMYLDNTNYPYAALTFSTFPIVPNFMGTGTPVIGCTIAQQFYQTDAVAGSNLWLCTATDTWTPFVGGSGGGDMFLASVQTSTGKKTFQPTATVAGTAVTCAALPSVPVNGDLACDSGDSNRVKVYSNGAWITIATQSTGDMILASVQTSTGKKTFSPTGTVSGLQLTCAALPSVPVNGDIACDSAASNQVKVYSNGAWITLGSGSGDMLLASVQTSTGKKTFTPTATVAGEAVTCAALPSVPVNGDIACDSGDSNQVKVYSNGAWVTVGSGSGATTFGALTTCKITIASAVATIGAPCGDRIGSIIHVIPSSTTVTISGTSSSGTAWAYFDNQGTVTIGHNTGATFTCSPLGTTGCVEATGITGFPTTSTPIATLTFVSNLFTVVTDYRQILSRTIINCGTGLAYSTDAYGADTCAVDPTYVAIQPVGSTQQPAANTRRVCDIAIGDTSGSALSNGQLGPQKRVCYIPAAATVVEIDIAADDGTPNIQIAKNHAGAVTNLLSGVLATAASGGIACAKTSTAQLCLDGATTSSGSVTVSTTALALGDYIELVSGTAGGVAKFFTAHIIYTIN